MRAFAIRNKNYEYLGYDYLYNKPVFYKSLRNAKLYKSRDDAELARLLHYRDCKVVEVEIREVEDDN